MPRKAKWSKHCPADYHDENQCDSDDDPEYICEEPVSPKISQVKGCDTYKKRQYEKNKKSTATPKRTKGGQTSPATPRRTKGDKIHQQLLYILHLKQVMLENANMHEL